jgi:hypothetical protein
MRLWISLFALLTALPAAAQVYTYIDSEGNRVFTDQPHKGAKRVDLPPSNRISSPASTPPARTVKKPPKAPQVQQISYQMLRILVPLPDAAVREESGELIVTVTSEPALQEGNFYRLLLDGEAVTQPSRSPVFALKNVDRGSHKLAVEILAADGYVLERTAPQPFHMQRISLSQKRRQNPCTTENYGVRPECPLTDKPEEESSILPFL